MADNHYKQEKLGAMFALLSGMIGGLFPVFINRGVKEIPPLFFAGASVAVAVVGALCYAAYQKKFKEFKITKAYPPMLMVTIFIVIIPYILLFIGASKTSGVNTAVLLLCEIIFTTIFTHFYGEKTSLYKILGAIGIFCGSLLILYSGAMKFNWGDILIILSTISYPIGNFYSKKSLCLVSPPTIILFRFIVSGIFLLALSFLFESMSWGKISSLSVRSWFFILFNGLIILSIGKAVWYEALKRLDISKAISLEMTAPFFSLLVLVLFFGEQISLVKWSGILIMLVGVIFSVLRKSTNPHQTKYGQIEEHGL